MKSFKKFAFLLLILSMAMTVLMTACGEDKSESSEDKKSADDTSVVAETTAILETTADGGTVEKDSEGNIVTKDSSGKVVNVKDKDGNPVNVDTYLTTHSWIEKSGSDFDENGSNNLESDDENRENTSKNGSVAQDDKGNSGANGTQNSDTQVDNNGSNDDKDFEGSIPAVIATMPDEEDFENFPDL